MYSVTINKVKIEVEKIGEHYRVNNQVIDGDLQQIGMQTFHFIRDNASFRIELLDINLSNKTLTVKLNNKIASLVIKDKFDILLEKLGMNKVSAQAVSELRAPMPGSILEIKVKAGDIIEKGDPVLILEAMKMENLIKSSGKGEIKEVLVDKGSSVEKNQVLIIFK